MAAYYNEIEPYAVQWLRNLIARNLIAPGDVDTRPIQEVHPDDIRKYTQCHFFAGIGGWSRALRIAGWNDDRPVWTGSCPCQPFSTAGKQEGIGDERHLWPYWYRLIGERRPATVFGEQVAGAIAFGWLDEVFNGLETEGYTCAASVLPACSITQPHKRDRIWFLAHTGESKTGNARSSIMGNAQCDGLVTAKNGGSDAPDIRKCEGGTNGTEQFEGTGSTGILPASGAMGVTISEGLQGFAGDGKNVTGGGQNETRSIAPSNPCGSHPPQTKMQREQ